MSVGDRGVRVSGQRWTVRRLRVLAVVIGAILMVDLLVVAQMSPESDARPVALGGGGATVGEVGVEPITTTTAAPSPSTTVVAAAPAKSAGGQGAGRVGAARAGA